MILEGIFGKVNVAYNDFRGHGYHGIGLLRSYVGFDNEPVQVYGFAKVLRFRITFGVKDNRVVKMKIGSML